MSDRAPSTPCRFIQARAATRFVASGLQDMVLLNALAEHMQSAKYQNVTADNAALSSASKLLLDRELSLWSDPGLHAMWGISRFLPPPPPPPTCDESDILSFDDIYRDLCIDIGCGFGGYVLGMAMQKVSR